MKGLSVINLKQMRSFADAWPDFPEIGQNILANLPWGHNLTLISKVQEREKRLWYAHKAVENGFSAPIGAKTMSALHRNACSLELLVGGTVSSSRNTPDVPESADSV